MAHIREEGGLRTVQLGEYLGALALGLIGGGARQRSGNQRSRALGKLAVLRINRPPWTRAEDEKPSGTSAGSGEHRGNQRRVGGLGPGASRKRSREALVQAGDGLDVARTLRLGERPWGAPVRD